MVVRIVPNESSNPPGKLADAELVFEEGVLTGLKLIGFAIWERKGGAPGRNVTFPARQYAVNGERRSYALLRPLADSAAQEPLRQLILQAFAEYRGACGDRAIARGGDCADGEGRAAWALTVAAERRHACGCARLP